MPNPVSLISNFITLHFCMNGDCAPRKGDNSEYTAHATGFLYRKNEEFYLITNLHVASGRNIFTQQPLDKNAVLPTSITFTSSILNKDGVISKVMKFELRIPLYDEQGFPIWLVHPKFKRTVDIAAIPIKLLNSPLKESEKFCCITDIELQNDLVFDVSDDVFVVGYPFGRGSVFSTLLPVPVWKRASIASEMDWHYYMDDRPVFLVDTTTKTGMSGSPVIGITKGIMRTKNGSVTLGTGCAMQLLGIYSGRIDGNLQNDSCLGLVWKKELIDETIEGNTRDETY